MSDGHRPARIAETIRGYLAESFTKLDDPRLSALVVTGLTVTPGLEQAKVSVRLLVGDDDPRERKRVMLSLKKVTGTLRKGLGSRLRVRRLPELRFRYDDGIDNTKRVEQLLAEIDREPKGEDPDDAEE